MFLPINRQDMEARGLDSLDFVYISGDAYVDHPSFGHALLTRLIESRGYTVGIVAQPTTDADYLRLGVPKRAFLVGSGVVDSMVNNYTAAKRKRSEDVYSEGGISGKRPDRALTVYCKTLRRLCPDAAVIAGGIEGSLRRFSHYDYWSDAVMQSVLVDSDADLLIYGMGEKPFLDLIAYCDRNVPLKKLHNIRGTAYLATTADMPKDALAAVAEGDESKYEVLPSHDRVSRDKTSYCKAFMLQSSNTDPINGKGLIQKQDYERYVVQNPPQFAMTEVEMDTVYALPYERAPHPMYKLGVPSIEEVEFSITAQRGCFGNCAFCAIAYHQGRIVQNRSKASIVSEARLMTESPRFKGYIHDVGGPSANFYHRSCEFQKEHGMCKNRDCIGFRPCKNLDVDHSDYLDVLRAVRELPGIKKVFVRSGVRFDYVMMDPNPKFFEELVKHHVSGQLKIAPEHACDHVLEVMNKPPHRVYEKFCSRFDETTVKVGLNQYVVPYFISSHPGCTVEDAIALAEYLHAIDYMPKQVQDFYPTPSTLATTMYYTGLDPRTMQPVYVAKTDEDKAMQRALLQYRLKFNRRLVTKALTIANRTDLIGYAKECLIRPDVNDRHTAIARVSSADGNRSAAKGSEGAYRKNARVENGARGDTQESRSADARSGTSSVAARGNKTTTNRKGAEPSASEYVKFSGSGKPSKKPFGGSSSGGKTGGKPFGGASSGGTAGGKPFGASSGGKTGGKPFGGASSGGKTGGKPFGGASSGGTAGGKPFGASSGGKTSGKPFGGASSGGSTGGKPFGGASSGGSTGGKPFGGASSGGKTGGKPFGGARNSKPKR